MLFELERATIARDGKVVLQDVSASLPKGASCVAGPSGSGKSTLLRLLNRLADPDSGVVALRRRPTCASATRSSCGARSAWCRSCRRCSRGRWRTNIRFAADLAGARAGRRAAARPRRARRRRSPRATSGKLSVGEQQRAMLARALALEPRVLLLDEPTSALDEDARDAVEATLLHLRERVKVSTVLVTHDLAQARRMADWVVRLDEGRLVAQGPVAEQLAAPDRAARIMPA